MEPDEVAAAAAPLRALIAAAAPAPVPAAQAIPLLRGLRDLPVEDLGRLTYQALTGIEPGTDPVPPAIAVPGFPAFAGEVVHRAIVGPDHRRPTTQALLIVLDTVPIGSWPSPPVPAAAPAPDPLRAEDDDTAERAATGPVAGDPLTDELVADVAVPDELVPDVAVARPPRSADLHEEFRQLLLPSRDVPLLDPDLPPAASEALDPRAALEAGADGAAPVTGGMHEEFRDLVQAGFDVPHFEPLAGAAEMAELSGLGEGADGRRRVRSGRRRRRSHLSRRVLVVLLVVLVVVAAVYVATRGSGEGDVPVGGPATGSQGASRSIVQASPERV